jgi:hypothetical protein
VKGSSGVIDRFALGVGTRRDWCSALVVWSV